MPPSSPGSAPPSPVKSRLLLVDDHPVVRQGLAQLLNQEPDLAVVGQATNAIQGLDAARQLLPDLAVVDISMHGASGLDLVKDLRSFLPKLPILVLSMHDESLYAERALRAGARGYVMKQEATENVVTAIRRILAGHLHVSEAMSTRMVSKAVGAQPANGAGSGEGRREVDSLSDRELQVLGLIGRGKGTRAVAGELHLSIKTVETYRAHLKEKLHLKDAPELVRFAVEWVHREGNGG